MPTRLLVALALFSLPATPSIGADLEYTLIARSAGPIRSVTVQGDYAFAGVGHQVWVFNVASQPRPTLEFECEALPHPIEKVAIHNQLLFVAAGRSGLFIYDISVPDLPTMAASFDTPGVAVDVAANGVDAYVAAQGAGLRSIHITDLGALYEHNWLSNPDFVVGVAVDGSRVAATTVPSGVTSFISVHAAAAKLSNIIPVHGTARGLDVRADTAYIAAGNAGLRIVDVSPILHPPTFQEIGFSKKPGPEDAFDVTLSGDLAFVADRTVSDGDELYRRGGMRIVDVSDPTQPTELGSVKGDVWSVAVSGDRAIVADYTRGRLRNTSSLDIIDVSDPSNPTRSGSFTVPPEIKPPMVASGMDVYTIDNHLRRFDLTDPARPRLAWSLPLPRDTYFRGRLTGLAVDGQYAYVGGGSAGLHIVDLSDPGQPQLAATVDIEAYDVLADGDRVFASELFGGLSIVDASNAMMPSVIGTISGNFSVSDMIVTDDVLYIAPYPGASLIIFDIADPATPMLLDYFFAGETIHHIETGGTYMYLAIGDVDKRIEVADVSEPSDPQFVSTFDVQYANVSDMKLVANSLYFTVPTVPGGGLRILDVSNPNNLRRQGKYVMRGEFAHGVAVLPDNIVALGGSSGLLILKETAAAGS